MRYAIISDIHANLQAFEAVLTDLSVQRADGVLCLGDAVGYGPQPAEVLSLVHAHVNEMVLGNHEAAVAGLMDTANFDPGALASLTHTRRKLNADALRYLAALPPLLEGPGFLCSHGDFSAPGEFLYVETVEDAVASFRSFDAPLLFVGHTHAPAVFVLAADGVCRVAPVQDFTLQPGCRYLVNPGSVGMPREQDPRAAYCIYDAAARRLSFHRTSYSVPAFRRLLEQDTSDSDQLAYVLSLLDSHELPVLNARMDFAARPAAKPAGGGAARNGSRPAAKKKLYVPAIDAIGAGRVSGVDAARRRGSGGRPGSAARRGADRSAAWAVGAAVLGLSCLVGGGIALARMAHTRRMAVIAAARADEEAEKLAAAEAAAEAAEAALAHRPAPRPPGTPARPVAVVPPRPPAPVVHAPAAGSPPEPPEPAAPARVAAPERPAPEPVAPPPPSHVPGRPPNGVRLKMEGGRDQIPLKVKASGGAGGAAGDWVPDKSGKIYQANLSFPAPQREWRQGEWLVLPEKDGEVVVTIGGLVISVRERRWMYYDDIRTEGADLKDGDFEDARAWKFDPTGERARIVEDAALAHGGSRCVMAGSPASISQSIRVQAGRPVKLTFWYRAVE